MYARLTTFDGTPEGIQAGIDLYRQEVIPWIRDATGFRGWLVLRDPEGGGRSVSITFWTDEATMRDQEASGGTLRDEVVANLGIEMKSMEFYDVAVAESIHLNA